MNVKRNAVVAVLFTVALCTCAVAQDVIPPTVLSTDPAHSANDVPIDASVSVTFSEPMDQAATEAAFSISPPVAGPFSWASDTLTFTPSDGLGRKTTYTVTIAAGPGGATDTAATPNPLDTSNSPIDTGGDYAFTFTTTAPADVTGLALTPSDEEIVMVWRNPYDVDFAGVVILRSVDAAPTGAPADGTTYIVGNVIENAVMIHVGVGSSGIPGNLSGLTETGLENGREYHYAVFAHDGEMNYSAGVSASATPAAPDDDWGCAAGGGRSPLTPMLLVALLALAFGRPCRAARERA